MRFPIAVLLVCVVLLTAFATVLFAQHEADRGAQRRSSSAAPAPVLTCPPVLHGARSARAGEPVGSLSDC